MKNFLPSLIEVPFGNYYKKCATLLFNSGFNSFHIDFGDKLLIKRKILPWEKIDFLKSLGNNLKLTAHIMCKSGDHDGSIEKVTKECLRYNFETIYVHTSSFEDLNYFKLFINKFFSKNIEILGIASEIVSPNNHELIELINEANIQKFLQMGVLIGSGGQLFNPNSLNNLNNILINCPKVNYLELDGGLTKNVLKDLTNSKINSFSGWSIIAHEDPEVVVKNAIELKRLYLQ
ncbi:hypothetical protein N9Z35_07360 [Alphaproteobacteria bacterium]|nr:hypothetical protein [Alphaproteobacteria bacterium]